MQQRRHISQALILSVVPSSRPPCHSSCSDRSPHSSNPQNPGRDEPARELYMFTSDSCSTQRYKQNKLSGEIFILISLKVDKMSEAKFARV